jgi:SAM-dependent methyltransferase
MIELLDKKARQRQTLASFDYQWRCLPDGEGMLSDAWFNEHVADIVSELTGIAPAWFRGKRVLDAGCGGGRWSVGLLRLGAHVTAVDFSEAGLDRTRQVCEGLGPLETLRVNLLDPPPELSARRFDLVFSFGVLHHTGDTFKALDNVARLVADHGLLFLYLYGSASWDLRRTLWTNWVRFRLAGLSFDEKVRVLRAKYPWRDPHQCFDLLSPTINHRLRFADVRARLEGLGFVGIAQTVPSGEIFLRAARPGFTEPHQLRPVPVRSSVFRTHYSEVERLYRDRAHEKKLWELAAARPDPVAGRKALDEARRHLELAPESVRGRRVLVVSPDGAGPASALAAAGVRVVCLTPTDRWGGGEADALARLPASTLDEPQPGEEPFDFVFSFGSANLLARDPVRALRQLAARLAPGGHLVVQSLVPGQGTFAQRLRRLALKLVGFDRKIALLARRHPECGIAEVLSLLSPGLPRRLPAEQVLAVLRDIGLTPSRTVTDGQTLYLVARSPIQEETRPSPTPELCAESQGS